MPGGSHASAVLPTGDTPVAPGVAYDYDRNDRLTNETATGANAYSTSYSYGSGDSATQVTQKQTTLPGSVTETITYVYDERGRLKTSTVEKTGEATVVADYKYDDSGIRVSQTIGSTRTLYLIDAQNPTGYAQVLEEGSEAVSGGNGKIDDAEVVRTYAYGFDLLTQANAASLGGQVLHFLYDAHGSTRALVELSGGASSVALSSSVRQIYSYDAYGNMLGFAAGGMSLRRHAGVRVGAPSAFACSCLMGKSMPPGGFAPWAPRWAPLK